MGFCLSMKILLNISISVLFIVILGIIGTTLITNISLFGGHKAYLVLSGSMEPAIRVGDLIIIKKEPVYSKGDVITFKSSDERIVTHRIFSIKSESENNNLYVTKGDANRTEDNDVVAFEQIMGKVAFIVPKLGYLADFSRSWPGLIVLILIPASILIGDEILNIFRHDKSTA